MEMQREPMPYHIAFLGIVSGMLFLTVFSYKAGMSLWVIPIFFGLYFPARDDDCPTSGGIGILSSRFAQS